MMKKPILLVEDDFVIAACETKMLERYGYGVVHVPDGRSAVEYMRANASRIGLVLMDIDLDEGVDGTEVAQEILKEIEVPIVFISAHTEKEIVEKTEKITSYGYVVKNSGITVLDASIKMALKLFDAHTSIKKQKMEIECLYEQVRAANECMKIEIENRKQIEESLKDSEADYRRLLESGNDAIFIHPVTEDGYPCPFILVNNKACERLGYSREELLKLSPVDIDAPEYSTNLSGIIKTLMTEKQCVFETEHMTRDGRRIPVEVNAQLFMHKGVPTVLSIARDISGRRRAEEALRESEDRFCQAMNAVKDGLWDWDLISDRCYFSPAYYRMLGYEPGEFPALGQAWSEIIHPDDRERVLSENMKCIKNQLQSFEVEYRIRTKDGGWKWILGRGSAVSRDASGRATRMIGTHVDITERKKYEERIRGLLEEKEMLIREVHHRIKNNMNTILGTLAMQADGHENELVRSVLYEVSCRLQSMMVLYDKLYRAEKISALSFKEYLSALVGEITGVFLRKNPVKTCVNIEDDFSLDPKKIFYIGIIINELITNSIKYAFDDSGDAVIGIAVHKNGNHISITYEDNGKGLPESFSLNSSGGFGIQLIQLMIRQIKGALTLERLRGPKFRIDFSI